MNLRLGDLGARVAHVQKQLRHAGYHAPDTHIFDAETEFAVAHFQHENGLIADGIVGVLTRAALALGVPGETSNNAIKAEPESKRLSDEHLEAAAQTLRLPVAVIRTIHEVESRSSGFLADGRPAILFERHVFYRRLRAHSIDPEPYAHRHPGLVATKPGGYRGPAGEHERLAAAERIHLDAARESASWGAFQIMGYHWKALRYESLSDFIDRMYRHESEHLDAFIRFIQADRRLHTALAKQEWAIFARGYNGPGYAANLYDAKLIQAHARYVTLETRLA